MSLCKACFGGFSWIMFLVVAVWIVRLGYARLISFGEHALAFCSDIDLVQIAISSVEEYPGQGRA